MHGLFAVERALHRIRPSFNTFLRAVNVTTLVAFVWPPTSSADPTGEQVCAVHPLLASLRMIIH
jgi:hypothetical protein